MARIKIKDLKHTGKLSAKEQRELVGGRRMAFGWSGGAGNATAVMRAVNRLTGSTGVRALALSAGGTETSASSDGAYAIRFIDEFGGTVRYVPPKPSS